MILEGNMTLILTDLTNVTNILALVNNLNGVSNVNLDEENLRITFSISQPV